MPGLDQITSLTSQNPTIGNVTTAMAGTYTVTVTNVCTATSTVTVVITAAPTASAAIMDQYAQAPNLTTTAVTGATYAWTGPVVTPQLHKTQLERMQPLLWQVHTR